MVVMGVVPRRGDHRLSSVCITWPWLMWTCVLHSTCDHLWVLCLWVLLIYRVCVCVWMCVCVCVWMFVCVCACVCVCVWEGERLSVHNCWLPILSVSFLSEAVPVLWVGDSVVNKEDTVLAVTHQGGGCCSEYHTNECLNWGLKGKKGWAVPCSGQVMSSSRGWRKRWIWGIERKLVWLGFRGQGDSC